MSSPELNVLPAASVEPDEAPFDPTVKVLIRMPKTLRTRIHEVAFASGVSMNQYLLNLLERQVP